MSSNMYTDAINKVKEYLNYREEYKMVLSEFKYAVQRYFLDKYDVNVNVLFYVDTFGVEQRYTGANFPNEVFHFSIDVLSDFCKTFDCDFKYTTCDGSRYIFTLNNLNKPFNDWRE